MIMAEQLTEQLGGSKVYFTSMRVATDDSIPKKLERLLKAAGLEELSLDQNMVAIKTHFGEYGNVTHLKPAYTRTVAGVVKELGGIPFAMDCNTLYPGMRWNAVSHLECAALNGFNQQSCGCPVIIGDGLRGEDEVSIPTPAGSILTHALIGRTAMEADTLITLTHAKGCHSSSYGGVLKNLGMGCASRAGKMIMHSRGKCGVREALCIGCGTCIEGCGQDAITIRDGKAHIEENCVGCGHCVSYCPRAAIGGKAYGGADLQIKMAEYAAAIALAQQCFHIAVAIDITPGCDCFMGNDAPMVPNIGMFASSDPVALDQAIADSICAQAPLENGPLVDLYAQTESDCDHLRAVNPESDWSLCLQHAEELGAGTRQYEIIAVS